MDAAERRRYRRYAASSLRQEAMLKAPRNSLENGGAGVKVLNISYGGICFAARFPLQLGGSLPLWVVTPLGLALVRVRIHWIRRLDAEGYVAGAEYLESSKGWFGPEEDAVAGVDRDSVALVGALDEDRPDLE